MYLKQSNITFQRYFVTLQNPDTTNLNEVMLRIYEYKKMTIFPRWPLHFNVPEGIEVNNIIKLILQKERHLKLALCKFQSSTYTAAKFKMLGNGLKIPTNLQ